jgi:hypothetical protein
MRLASKLKRIERMLAAQGVCRVYHGEGPMPQVLMWREGLEPKPQHPVCLGCRKGPGAVKMIVLGDESGDARAAGTARATDDHWRRRLATSPHKPSTPRQPGAGTQDTRNVATSVSSRVERRLVVVSDVAVGYTE